MKRILTILMFGLSIIGIIGCEYEIVKVHSAHDINIKLINSLDEEWILTPDMEKDNKIQMQLEYNYTGNEIGFWVESYQFVGCDRIHGDEWLNPHGTFSFEYSVTHTSLDETQNTYESFNQGITIKEKGLYYVRIHNDRRGLEHWNFVTVFIIINII